MTNLFATLPTNVVSLLQYLTILEHSVGHMASLYNILLIVMNDNILEFDVIFAYHLWHSEVLLLQLFTKTKII